MRKIGKGLILTALFAVCTVGMVGVNLNAATLQNKDQKSYDIEIMTDGQIPGADSSTTEAPTTEEPTTEAPKNGWVKEPDGRKYYVNGVAKTGSHVAIKDSNGKKYYYSFDKKGNLVYGLVKVNGKLYYHSSSDKKHPGAAVTGWQQIKGKKYYFSKKTCAAYTGYKKIGNSRYFFDSKGRMLTKKWKTVEKRKYYFGKDGKAKTGLVKISGKKYYFSKKGVLQKSKFVKYKGKKYYLGKTGKAAAGEVRKVNSSYYYFNKSASMIKSSWIKTSKGKYYFGKSGKAYTGSHKINNKVYVFRSNGTLVTQSGLVTISGKTYYMNSNGTAQTGYKKIGDAYYYFGKDGVMYRKKWAYVGGYKFYFCSNGKRAVEVDDVIGDQDAYEIIINKKTNVVTVYAKDGKNGYIIPVRAFICSTGVSTPLGTFHTQSRYRWHELMGPCWGQWCSGIYEGYLFHSVYYNDVNNNNALSVNAYNKLGTTCSHGCVRLTAGDAKWIYDHCSVGTKVTIINESGRDPFPKPTAYKLPSWHTWDPTDPNMQYKCKQKGCH